MDGWKTTVVSILNGNNGRCYVISMLLVSGSVDQLGDSCCNSSPKTHNFSVLRLRLSRSTRHFVRKLPNRRGTQNYNLSG